MVIRKDLKPFRQSVPNAAALAMAGDIAARLGLPFDAQAVAEQSRSLYENMFADLKQVLEIEAPPRLESGSYSLTRLFLTPDAARAPVIVLDIYFDYWIAALSQIAAIATFTVPDKPLWLALGARMSETFELFVEPSRFETARQNMAPLFADHGELMNISFGMARAMTIFALCHELAHWQCGHLDQAPGAEQELEADREAASLFLRLVQRGEKAAETSVFIDPKVAGAPLLLARPLARHSRFLFVWLRPRVLFLIRWISYSWGGV